MTADDGRSTSIPRQPRQVGKGHLHQDASAWPSCRGDAQVMRLAASSSAFALSLPSQLGSEKLVRHLLTWLLPQVELAPARSADLQTAVSEACINAIEHGNQGRPGCRVQVEVRMTPSYVEAVVTDEGRCCAQRPTRAATMTEKVAGEAPPRGMGLLLIEQLVDESAFVPVRPECGTQMRLRQYR